MPLPPGVQEAAPRARGVISAVAVRQPVGVVVCITSYNFPMTNMAGKIGPALAMGNTVVVKPAPQDPLQVIRMVELIARPGSPRVSSTSWSARAPRRPRRSWPPST